MSGQWPPEWEDPDDERPDAGLPDGHRPDDGHSDLELSEVTSFLASVHSPALPASFEARISAAIAAEAAARAASEPRAAAEPAGPLTAAAGAGDAKDTDRSGNPEEFSPAATAGGRTTPARRRPRRGWRGSRSAAAASGPGGSRPGGGRRRLRMPSMQAASWTLVCVLVLAGFGFLVTRSGGSSSSSQAESSPASQPAASAAGPAGKQPDAEPAAGTLPEAAPSAGSAAGLRNGFLVYSTGVALSAIDAGQPGAGRARQPRPRPTGVPPTRPTRPRPPRAALGQRARRELVGRRRGAVGPALRVRVGGHRRRRAELGGQGQLRRNPGVHHRGADTGVGGGTRLHGGRHAAHRAGTAHGLAGISAP